MSEVVERRPDNVRPPRLFRATFLPPEYRVPLLHRQRLLDTLDEAVNHRMVLVQAPAGCGKTTLLCQWHETLKGRGVTSAWLNMYLSDLEPGDFVLSIAWALHLAGIDFSATQLLVDGWQSQMSASEGMGILLSEIAPVTGRVVLLLDDFDRLNNRECIDLVDFFVLAAPPNLHFVIAARQRPALSISRLHAGGNAHIIPTQELLFAEAESLELLRSSMSPRDAEILMARTQGWPVAVQLANLWMRQRLREPRELENFSGYSGDIAEFLAEQVVASLPEELAEFLFDISVLDQVTAALVDGVRRRRDSLVLLEQIKPLYPLLTSTDRGAEEYRLHPLLAEHLRERLRIFQPDRFALLHATAARELAKTGRILEAVRHALTAEAPGLAADLLEAQGPVRLCITQGAREVRTCLRLLTSKEWESHPGVWLARILILIREGKITTASEEYKALAHLGIPEHTEFESSLVRACLALYHPSLMRETLKQWQYILGISSGNDELIRGLLYTFEGIYLIQHGALDDAEALFTRAIPILQRAPEPIVTHVLDLHCQSIAIARGKLSNADASLRSLVKKGRRIFGPDRSVLVLARALQLIMQYESDSVELANTEVTALLNELERSDAYFDYFAQGYRVAAELAFRTEGLRAALRQIACARGVEQGRLPDGCFGRVMSALEVIFLARAGEVGVATERVRLLPDKWSKLPTWYERDAVVQAQIRIALVTDRAAEAVKLSRAWIHGSLLEGRKTASCRGQLACGAALHSLGRDAYARRMFASALELGATDQLFAPFLEYADVIPDLFVCEAKQATTVVAEFAVQITEKIKGDVVGQNPVERLSAREREVVKLLCLRESNKGIARQLDITEDTVKFHLKNVFRKLGVRSRECAISAVEDSR